jgi:hypothetical protein
MNPNTFTATETTSITWSTAGLVLFDAADRPSIEGGLEFKMNPGQYTIKTLDYRPTDDVCLLIHALLPVEYSQENNVPDYVSKKGYEF